MQFANYVEFRNAVLRFIDGDDANGSIKQDTLDLLIALGESRVYLGDESVSGLRASDMAADLSLAITNNTATLPDDCLALSRVQFDGESPLDYLPEDQLLRMAQRGGGSGAARYYTQQGRNLIFYPEATGTVGGRYYQRPADLLTGEWPAVFVRYPECFLFAALAEAAPFIGEDNRLPVWKALWAGWMSTANKNERLQAPDGSRLMTKAR